MVQTFISSWLSRTPVARAQSRGNVRDGHHEAVEMQPADFQSEKQTIAETATNGHSASAAQSKNPSNRAVTSSPSSAGVPSNVSIEPISASNIKSFKRLISLLLPIPYPDGFFTETIEDEIIASLSRAAFWRAPPRSSATQATQGKAVMPPGAEAQLVAAIRCRLLASPPGQPDEEKPVLYISTITTLAPFRRHALATRLLQTVASAAAREYGALTIVAHVWEANDEGMEWYKKLGFRVEERMEGYYRKLAPRTAALLVRKDMGIAELFEWERALVSL